jgi:hypothetical protein
MTSAVSSGAAAVPEGLVASVVELVGTGPVMLGAYTVAELTAVDAIVDFLEARPSDEVLAEAVRSLAARELLVAGPEGSHQIQVRGDLGIAVAFQQRARTVLDARATGTVGGEPWRVLLLPQPERITLVIRIDALGIHELGLYPSEDALRQLTKWLPSGDAVEPKESPDADAVLANADRSALITVSTYTSEGSAEVVRSSTDLVLARKGGRLYAYQRDGQDASRLVPRSLVDDKVHPTIVDMLR